MNESFIKLHRKFLEWEWIDDETMVYLFIRLLFKANWEAKSWHGITIERGQFVTGRKSLSQELHMSERSLRTRLERLKQTGEISIKTTNQFSIITICKYDSYQSNQKENDQRSTNKRPAIDQQTTTTKEYKNIRTNRVESTHARENFQPAEKALSSVIANGSIQQVAKNANELFSLIETKARDEPEWWKKKIKDYCEIDMLTKQQRQDSIKLWANHLFTNNPADLWNWSKTEASLQKWLIRERIRATQS